MIQPVPLPTLSPTVLSSGSCCWREYYPHCSLSNYLLLTNTCGTSNCFRLTGGLASVTRALQHRLTSRAFPANPDTSISAPTGEITDEKRAMGLSVGYSVGKPSSTDLSSILLWLICGLIQFDSMQLTFISHRASNLTKMCETPPSFWHCFFSQLCQSFHKAAVETMSLLLDLVHHLLPEPPPPLQLSCT